MTIKFIVIHCSDSPDNREVSASEIHRWHLERGWSGIGYNEVVMRSGEVQHGRPPYWAGAHVQDFNGDGLGNNNDSIGICLIGRDAFNPDQMDSLAALVGKYLEEYPDAEVVGHRDLDPRKTCPNFDVRSWWTGVKKPQTRSTRNYLR